MFTYCEREREHASHTTLDTVNIKSAPGPGLSLCRFVRPLCVFGTRQIPTVWNGPCWVHPREDSGPRHHLCLTKGNSSGPTTFVSSYPLAEARCTGKSAYRGEASDQGRGRERGRQRNQVCCTWGRGRGWGRHLAPKAGFSDLGAD